MTTRRLLVPAALGAVSVLALAGCASGETSAATPAAESTVAEPIIVVTSTNVYGQIAQEIGGEFVEVTSIVTSGSQDPHSYEASAQDQLTVADADIVVENGGGYDAFVDGLLEASGSDAHVITVAEFSHDWPGADAADHDHDHAHADDATTAEPEATAGAEVDDHDHAHEGEEHAEGDDHAGHDHVEGFNEHVWYDPHTIEHFAEALAEEFAEQRPEDAAAFEANAAAFIEGIADLEATLAEIDAAHAGEAVFVTEPVPVYLATAAGLENVTPEAFSEAVEEGQDVPPATLLEAMNLLADGDVRVVIANAQTGGAETTQIIADAEGRGIPVIEFSETLPEGQTYLSWMQENITALSDALSE
ncbi:metal ABC transporter solute-binding protein, Zn/Mn family [Microbacterium aurantiacum]|uniref:metal ABC transporter solute-binding protein, Zn/Mn family n=1 Tax=Microbacterium aurantiacum TaxID=162393 RepID=UPI001F413BF0|nr:zinc ABC transporter substrate-binding protein [Microbacterium aurantiacum]